MQIIGYITGDGIGEDITPVVKRVIDAAVKCTYKGERSIAWKEIFVGERATKAGKEALSLEALERIRQMKVVLKGPLTTPVGSGFRSLNVAIRQKLDLYACIRPVRWFRGVPAPVKHPERFNIILFRENTEDVYSGLEWRSGSEAAEELANFLFEQLGAKIAEGSGIGIKPISKFASQRLVRAAIRHALEQKRSSVTLVHKGNIMKYTEGAFKEWGYEVAREEFGDVTCIEEHPVEGRIVIKDRIADAMFQQLLLRPEEYDVIATTNLNGDYLSDAAAAQVGGLGLAPGANINYEENIAVFEATHGTAPKYAGKDKVNPGSLLLSGVMMLRHLGWIEAADLIEKGLINTIQSKTVTYDLARQIEGANEVSCSAFGEAIILTMQN